MRRSPLPLLFLFAVSSPTWAGDLKPFDFKPDEKPGMPASKIPSCKTPDLKLPAKFAVYAAGASSGRMLAFQIDQTGKQATQVDVLANSPGTPVVLLLAGDKPTIWNIGWTEKTNVVAVFATGYDRQAIAGLKKGTPVFSNTHDTRGPCGFLIASGEKPETLDSYSYGLFGRNFDKVFKAENGKVVMGDPITPATKLFTSNDVAPESFHDKSAPLAGDSGLEEAVRKGQLRKATETDTEAWVSATHMQKKISLYKAYVVLKPFTYPAGLYGAHSATFLIPKGVPKPTGELGHSSEFDFNTLNCQGILCRSR